MQHNPSRQYVLKAINPELGLVDPDLIGSIDDHHECWVLNQAIIDYCAAQRWELTIRYCPVFEVPGEYGTSAQICKALPIIPGEDDMYAACCSSPITEWATDALLCVVAKAATTFWEEHEAKIEYEKTNDQ